MRKLFFTTLAVTGMLAAIPASADVFDDGVFDDNEYGVFDDSFGIWDQDGDDWLTRDEFDDGWTEVGFNGADSAFDTFDDDGNGFLDDDEFFEDDDFGVLDVDRDGGLSDNEWF